MSTKYFLKYTMTFKFKKYTNISCIKNNSSKLKIYNKK